MFTLALTLWSWPQRPEDSSTEDFFFRHLLDSHGIDRTNIDHRERWSCSNTIRRDPSPSWNNLLLPTEPGVTLLACDHLNTLPVPSRGFEVCSYLDGVVHGLDAHAASARPGELLLTLNKRSEAEGISDQSYSTLARKLIADQIPGRWFAVAGHLSKNSNWVFMREDTEIYASLVYDHRSVFLVVTDYVMEPTDNLFITPSMRLPQHKKVMVIQPPFLVHRWKQWVMRFREAAPYSAYLLAYIACVRYLERSASA